MKSLNEPSGKRSTCRIITLMWNCAVCASWLFCCVWTKTLVAIPESIVMLTLGVNAVKVGQRFAENAPITK